MFEILTLTMLSLNEKCENQWPLKYCSSAVLLNCYSLESIKNKYIYGQVLLFFALDDKFVDKTVNSIHNRSKQKENETWKNKNRN